eukprot:jgi/Chrzof1/5776/Cz16g15130.t1
MVHMLRQEVQGMDCTCTTAQCVSTLSAHLLCSATASSPPKAAAGLLQAGGGATAAADDDDVAGWPDEDCSEPCITWQPKRQKHFKAGNMSFIHLHGHVL